MASVVAGMTMSLDGFVADPRGDIGRLYWDLDELRESEFLRTIVAETGAVIMGRRAFAMGDPDWYVGNYEFQVPIFVLTHHPPAKAPKQDERLTFTFVTDGVESAVRQARAAAGEKAVQVIGGASVTRQLLRAGLVDLLRIDVMPVVLGGGLRHFEGAELAGLRLETIGVQRVGQRTSLSYRIVSR